jgi:hypothetical protein
MLSHHSALLPGQETRAMSDSLKSENLFSVEQRRGPWAIVLSSGQATRLGFWNRLVENPWLDASRAPGRSAVVEDPRDEVLRCHRDTRWH